MRLSPSSLAIESLLVASTLLASTLLASSLLTSSPAHAQGYQGVASSGMGQGEARITSRSDVRLSMESLPGTGNATVTALGARVGARMAQIRACYERTVAETPTVTGTLRLRMELAQRGRPQISVDRDGVENATLVSCISRELARVEVNEIRRPAGAVVQLEMQNSAARGAERAATEAERAHQVAIEIDSEGNASSNGGTPDQRVRFTVTGRGRESAPAVVAAHHALNTALPGLLDCRRRASRRGQSPAGEVTGTMQIRAGRAPTTRVTASTVPAERARACVSGVLRRIEQRAESGSGRVNVRIAYQDSPAE